MFQINFQGPDTKAGQVIVSCTQPRSDVDLHENHRLKLRKVDARFCRSATSVPCQRHAYTYYAQNRSIYTILDLPDYTFTSLL